MKPSPSFETLSPWLAVGEPRPPGWESIIDHPLLILVGLTGVGKTTTIAALESAGVALANLPNRRLITDQLIIGWLQAQDGEPVSMVKDRTARFDYTRRYREIFAGGMAYALTQFWLKSEGLPQAHLLFDGLRGENEVSHAVELLPKATFIVLDAPNDVRVKRLLGRDDAFDQVEPGQIQSPGRLKNLAELGLDLETILTPQQEQGLVHLVNQGQISPADLQAKLKIIVTESQNYDPIATIRALNKLAPNRTIVVDTARFSPNEIAIQIRDHLSG